MSQTLGGLWIAETPRPKEEPHAQLILSGRGGLLADEYRDGYYPGRLIVCKNGHEVKLVVTEEQVKILYAMGIEEYT